MGDSSDGTITLALGILIGAVFAYLIMKTRLEQAAPTTSTAQAMHVMYVPYPPPVPAVQATAPEKVKVQTAEPVPPALPAAKDVKVMELAKDNKGRLTLMAGDRKVGARA